MDRPARWPLALLLLGAISLLPWPSVRSATALLEDGCLTLRRFVDPSLIAAGSARATTADPAPDPGLRERLARAHARVLPPRESGWQRDGRFAAVALARARKPSQLALAMPGALPVGEPVFHGRELVGRVAAPKELATKDAEAGATRAATIATLRAKESRVPACAGVPGQRETRFLAIGDGTDLLRVAYAEIDPPLVEGDLAWAIDPPSSSAGAVVRVVEGALIGRIVRGDGPAGADRIDWRVEPLTPLSTLAEVAVRLPAGFLAPAEMEFAPLAVAGRESILADDRRRALLLLAGRDAGVTAGAAVSSGGRLVAQIVRSGWHAALARSLHDPGFRTRVLVLRGEDLSAFDLEVRGVAGDEAVELLAPPPIDEWDGAAIVTSASPEGVPEGLFLGALERRDDRCILVTGPTAATDEWIVHRPPGPWSAGE